MFFVTGSPMAEVLHVNMASIQSSRVLEELGWRRSDISWFQPTAKKILIASRRSISHARDQFHSRNLWYAVIYSTHPRSWKRIEERGFRVPLECTEAQTFGFFDYNKLQMNSFVCFPIVAHCLRNPRCWVSWDFDSDFHRTPRGVG